MPEPAPVPASAEPPTRRFISMVGAWSLKPPEEEFQVLHVTPMTEVLACPQWPVEPTEELGYPQWPVGGVPADPDPDPNLTMHRFAGKLLGYMKGKARDSQLVMETQRRTLRRARLVHKSGKWALDKLRGEAGEAATSPNTNPIPEAKGPAPSYQQDIVHASPAEGEGLMG